MFMQYDRGTAGVIRVNPYHRMYALFSPLFIGISNALFVKEPPGRYEILYSKCYTARSLSPTFQVPGKRARLWQESLKFWPPYADYQKKTEREIPVVVLDPVR